MLTLLLASALASDCSDLPPKHVPPWVHVERAANRDIVARGHLRAGEPHGTWCHWAPGGRLVESVTWQRGVRDGPFWRRGHNEGLEQGQFVEGERHGFWTTLGSVGEVKYQGNYDHGVPVGAWIQSDGSGELVAGERHGVWRFADREESYRHGELHGLRRQFDDDGAVHAEHTWVNGRLEGPFLQRIDGVTTRGEWDGDSREGEWEVRDSSGVVEAGRYVDGVRDGTWMERMQLGRVQTTWVAGQKTGPFEVWQGSTLTRTGQYRADLPHGAWTTFRAGIPEREITYADGELDGPFTVWASDGTVREQGEYADGYRQGVWVTTTAEGVWTGGYHQGAKQGVWSLVADGARREVTWLADRQHGVQRAWIGEMLVSQCGWMDGQQEGVCRTWQADGTAKDERSWTSGVQNGPYKAWHDTGVLAEQGTFVSGALDGSWQSFRDDGQPDAKGTYVLDTPVGDWQWWHVTGVVAEAGRFTEDGQRSGRWVTRYEDGQLASRGDYAAGEQQGTWTWWLPSGQRELAGDYAAGERVGVWRSWHRNGVVATEGTYVAGLRNGRWVYRSPNGRLLRTADFARGEVVAVDDRFVPFAGEPDPFLNPMDTHGPGEGEAPGPGVVPLGPGGLRVMPSMGDTLGQEVGRS